jgi:hypothetical protein
MRENVARYTSNCAFGKLANFSRAADERPEAIDTRDMRKTKNENENSRYDGRTIVDESRIICKHDEVSETGTTTTEQRADGQFYNDVHDALID